MHQRLTAREDYPLDTQSLDVREVPLQFRGGDFLDVGELPDIAHHAAAVAGAGRLEHKNRKTLQPLVHSSIRFPASRKLRPRCLAAARRSSRTLASTSTVARPSMVSG